MRLLGRVVALLAALLLGVAVGVVAVVLHQPLTSAVVAMGTTLAVMWALRWWLPAAVTAFGAGWLVALLLALAGRGEGDYLVSTDTLGWLLIGFGFVVLVTAVLWGRPLPVRHDSGSVGAPT